MEGWEVTDELEGIWKEVVVANFKVLSHYLPCGTEENHNTPSVMIAGLRVEIWARDLPNIKQEC
jgi:hypothetical protein